MLFGTSLHLSGGITSPDIGEFQTQGGWCEILIECFALPGSTVMIATLPFSRYWMYVLDTLTLTTNPVSLFTRLNNFFFSFIGTCFTVLFVADHPKSPAPSIVARAIELLVPPNLVAENARCSSQRTLGNALSTLELFCSGSSRAKLFNILICSSNSKRIAARPRCLRCIGALISPQKERQSLPAELP
jgi:hypothetical protein